MIHCKYVDTHIVYTNMNVLKTDVQFTSFSAKQFITELKERLLN